MGVEGKSGHQPPSSDCWAVGVREPLQKFGHWSLFIGQLLSRKQVSQKVQAPPNLSKQVKIESFVIFECCSLNLA